LLLCGLLVVQATAINAHGKLRDEKPYPRMRHVPAPSVVVTNTVRIPTAWKFNPVFWLKNYDRPLPPRRYKPNDRFRVLKWHLRNPFHNFDFYVIGIADKTFVRQGRFPDKVFAPGSGWNWAVCKYKWLRLPFVSYHRGAFNFYLGWRNRGQFGFEFKFSEPKENQPRGIPDRAVNRRRTTFPSSLALPRAFFGTANGG
jgi:hypothetical protein